MKKILSILLCVMIVVSFAACGKKDNEVKNPTNVMQNENVVKEDKVKDDSAESDDKGEVSSETKVLPTETAENLESMVDEFNTTDDPERKEELRKELEEFLKQAEAMAQ